MSRVACIEDSSRRTGMVLRLADHFAMPTAVQLAGMLHELTAIQRYVLARVATHCWTQDGTIPYFPPNAHQAAVARTLACPTFPLLLGSSGPHSAYGLSTLGDAVARRVLHVVPAALDRKREIEFNHMRRLMRSAWEPRGEQAA